ncbi:hypothetical protein BDV18DRAFT_149712 [Aspergillus unguis]
MTRVSRRTGSIIARRSPSFIARRKARKHKVILESVTQEKKKLRSVISFEAKAPPGYTFISAGDPHFTTTCKERCRRDGLKVYAVSTTPHMHTHGLSQHVHRIGYHFPSAVVADVCINRGLYLTAAGKAVSLYGTGGEAGRKHTDSIDQIAINTEARDVLKDLFPNIPDNDLNQIIKTAFQKGQRKVGTAVELPLARRAQLAVVAHIRHIYTDYDRLLKSTSFHEARATVEQPTLAKLVEWRGDDENGKTVLEDVFREVIVISDDDDESDFEGEVPPPHGRDTSVEIISSNPVVEELHMRPVGHGTRALRGAQVDTSEDETAPGFRLVRESPKKNKVDRRGFSRYQASRYQAWDRAIDRYRNTAASGHSRQLPAYPLGQPGQGNIGFGKEAPLRRPFESNHSAGPYVLSNQKAVRSNPSRPRLNLVSEHRVSCAPLLNSRNSSRGPLSSKPAVLTLAEPFDLYPLAELPDKRGDTLPPANPSDPIPLRRAPIPEPVKHHLDDSPNVPVFVSGPKESLDRNKHSLRPIPPPPVHLQNRNVDPQDRALPSIESPLAMEIKRPDSGHIERLAKRMSGAFTFRSVTPHRQNQDFSNHVLPHEAVQDHAAKRRRVAYHEPGLMERPLSPNGSAAMSTYPGNRYAMAGQPSVQNGPHARRRYFAPEPHHTMEREPGTVQGSSISTAHYDREGQNLVLHGPPPRACDSQRLFYNRHINPHTAHHRSPGQTCVVPDMRHGVAAGESRDRIAQPQLADSRDTSLFHNSQDHIASGIRPPETTGTRLEPVWQRNSRPYKPVENQRLYADGFVRHVDLREPEVLDYRPVRRLPPSPLVESPPQLVKVGFRGIDNQSGPPDRRTSVAPRGRSYRDSSPKAFSKLHPLSGQGARHHERMLPRTPPPIYSGRRQPGNAVNTSRYDQ